MQDVIKGGDGRALQEGDLVRYAEPTAPAEGTLYYQVVEVGPKCRIRNAIITSAESAKDATLVTNFTTERHNDDKALHSVHAKQLFHADFAEVLH